MKFKYLVIVLAFLMMHQNGFGQNGGGYFYDTLTIMDHQTNDASERLTRLTKPIKRNFYLKSDGISYSLFKGQTANLSTEQISSILEDGFSLYIDKLEHLGHKNLKPSVMEVLDENNEVVETIENLQGVEATVLGKKIVKDALLRFSGFIISVNEEKLGPIIIAVKVVE